MAVEAVDLAVRPASMSKTEAKRLTAQIKRQAGDVQQRAERLQEMVRRAQHENAWAALGYASWDDYVRQEFADLTRGQKHRLVAWSEVVGELEAAAGGPVKVSGRQAVKAKKAGAGKVAEKVREALAGKPDATPEDRKAALQSALAEPIEATATKVPGPVPAAQGVSTPPTPAVDPAPEQELPAELAERIEANRADPSRLVAPEDSARARATTAPAEVAAPVPQTAAQLLDALASMPAAEAAETVELGDLDRLAAWTGLVRAAVRRRGQKPATTTPAPAPAAKPKAPAPAPKDCHHPVNQILGVTCMACGATVKK